MEIRIIFFALSSLLSTVALSQKLATTFQNAIDRGISIEKLDEVYQSALHVDSTKAAFRGRDDEFKKAYTSFIYDLQNFLSERNFTWEKPTRCFNRIYIHNTGEIDYFLFNFKPGELNAEKEALFEKLLTEFIRNKKFPLTNSVHFAQCSPIAYTDKKD